MTEEEDNRVLVWNYWPCSYVKNTPPEFVAEDMTIVELKVNGGPWRTDDMDMFGTMLNYQPELVQVLDQMNLSATYTLEAFWSEEGNVTDTQPQWVIGLFFNFPNSTQATLYRLFYRDWKSKLA